MTLTLRLSRVNASNKTITSITSTTKVTNNKLETINITSSIVNPLIFISTNINILNNSREVLG